VSVTLCVRFLAGKLSTGLGKKIDENLYDILMTWKSERIYRWMGLMTLFLQFMSPKLEGGKIKTEATGGRSAVSRRLHGDPLQHPGGGGESRGEGP
jgi:hypothetical protein